MLIISKVSTTSETANCSEDIWRCDNDLHIINRSLVISNHQTRCLAYFFLQRVSPRSNTLYEAEWVNWSVISPVMINCYLSVCILSQWGIPLIVTWKHGILHFKNVEMYAWIITILSGKNIIQQNLSIYYLALECFINNSLTPAGRNLFYLFYIL